MKFVKEVIYSFLKLILSLFTFGNQKNQVDILKEEAVMSPGRIIVKNFLRNKLAMTGLTGFVTITLIVFVGAAIFPIDIYNSNNALRNLPPDKSFLKYPSELSKSGVKQIVSGRSFSAALDSNGKIFVWGVDQNELKNIPEELRENNIEKIAAGDRHLIAITSEGELILWGYNNHKQASIPVELNSILRSAEIVDIDAGDLFTAVLTESGRIYVWGATLANRLNLIPSEYQGEIIDISASTSTVLVIFRDNTVGYIGTGGTQLSSIPDSLTDGSTKVVSVAAATRTAIALDENGHVYGWGDSLGGLLNFPEDIANKSVVITKIDAGRDYFTALDENGKLYNWGYNLYGQIRDSELASNDEFTEVYSDFYQNYAVASNGDIIAWGNQGFAFGTDGSGRDMLLRLIHGGRITMMVGAVAVLISTVIGLLVGLIAGFYGKWLDNILMRFGEIINSFPFLPLAITLSAFLGDKLTQNQRIFMIMVILGVISWPGLSRLVRGQILAEREKDFVLAARALGIRSKVIILRHILPNVINIVIVSMTLGYASSLLTEAGLSFLGFGVIPPSPSWGNMLTGAQSSEVIEFFWWRWLLPAFSILSVALSVNIIGDGLRDAMDPKNNEK